MDWVGSLELLGVALGTTVPNLVTTLLAIPWCAPDRGDPPPRGVMRVCEWLWISLLPLPQELLFLDGGAELKWVHKRRYPFEGYQQGRPRCLGLVKAFAEVRHVVATDGPPKAPGAAVTAILQTSSATSSRLYAPAISRRRKGP